MPLVVRRYMERHAAPGAKAQIAREWNLHRSTITRDIQRGCGIEAWQLPDVPSARSTRRLDRGRSLSADQGRKRHQVRIHFGHGAPRPVR
jgi:IS30 family transposase